MELLWCGSVECPGTVGGSGEARVPSVLEGVGYVAHVPQLKMPREFPRMGAAVDLTCTVSRACLLGHWAASQWLVDVGVRSASLGPWLHWE